MLIDQDKKVESWKCLTFKVNEQENPVKKGYVGQVGINNVSQNDPYGR